MEYRNVQGFVMCLLHEKLKSVIVQYFKYIL